MYKKELLIKAGIDFKELPKGGFLIDVEKLSSEQLNMLLKKKANCEHVKREEKNGTLNNNCKWCGCKPTKASTCECNCHN